MEDFKEDPVMSLWTVRHNRQFNRHRRKIHYDAAQLQLLTMLADVNATIARYDRLIAKTRNIVTESEVISDSINSSSIETHENVLDVGGVESSTSSSGVSSGPNIGQQEILSITRFLERPVEVDTFELKVGVASSSEYPLWDIVTSQPSIRAKLRNFAYLRANIKVRIAISGTPFHAGKFLVSYQPYPLNNETLVNLLANVALDPTVRPLLLTYLSQAPGAIVMDVKDNRPLELHIPFISTKPMHRLFNVTTSAISAATAFADLENAGSLFFYTLNTPSAVSDTPTPISVQIYAWMQDVDLGTTTATQIEITTESERGPGPVEKVATSLATFSKVLKRVPGIAPVARASSMIFDGVAGLAAWFGWSRPIIEDDTRFVKNRPFTNSCVTIGKETAEKVTFDPLQELNIDPRICGVDVDELVLNHLTSIESFLHTFVWSPDDTPLADPIFLCKVTPTLCNTVAVATTTYAAPTPMSFVASAFQYWRGSMKFKFQIVCSAFHRGKLAFFYEPNIYQQAIIDADLSTNKNFLKIIDIQETQCVEFVVHWAQPRAWCLVPQSNTVHTNYSDNGLLTAVTPDYYNGYIGVVPFTDLQSPLSDDLSINVFVSSDDMQFNMMTEINFPSERLIITEASVENKHDGEVPCLDLNASSSRVSNVSDYHFGEQPLSFRTCLKRYVETARDDEGSPGNNYAAQWCGRILPLPMPLYGESSISYVNLLSYLRYAFLGVKGGLRKRVHFQYTENIGEGSLNNVVVSLATPFASDTPNVVTMLGAPPRIRQRGAMLMVPWTNGGIEFEIPYYSNNLFTFSCTDDGIGTAATDEMEQNWMKLYYAVHENYLLDTERVHAIECTAAAEDFTFMRFLGAPYYTFTTP